MDKQEMARIYEENVKYVYKYLFCLTKDQNLTDELTQETFYQAMKGIGSFRGECKISVWLCQIGKRLWYKELNKKKQQFVSFDEVEEYSSKDHMENQYFESVNKVELFKMLRQLDEITREVIYLRLTGELSFAEIGEILGRSESWARVTFYRGKQKLAKGRAE